MNIETLPLLSITIWCPIIMGVLLVAFGRDHQARAVRIAALLAGLLSFIVTLVLLFHFDKSAHGMQFVEEVPWITSFNVNYALGIDGISIWFVVLTAFMTLIAILTSWVAIKERITAYMAAFLILSGLMMGVFCTLDSLLFYVFFESTLIPMFLIIGVWGGEKRAYAALKFFLYTLLGSLMALIAMLYLYFEAGHSFSILTWHTLPLPLDVQIALFFAFLCAFAVKVPMWPVHTWLPDAHVEAPTGGSVILASIMLKLGAYGFLRFSLPIAPDASRELAPVMIGLSLIAVIYIGLVTLVQKDMKKLVAYSSVAHMGFVTLGFFVFNHLGIEGGIVQMISHGFVSGAMFVCIGVLYDRMHTRQIADYGGVVHVMPKYAVFFVLFSMANCGLPGTSGFVGEFMVILGAVKYQFWIGVGLATSLILGASYSLWMVKRVIYGAEEKPAVQALKDIDAREFAILGLLAVGVLAIGLYPGFVTDVTQTSVADLLQHIATPKVY